MSRRLFMVALFIALTGLGGARWARGEPADSTRAPAAAEVSFVKQVAPILVNRCQACHGVRKAENNYRLDSFNRLQQAGDNDLAPVTAGDTDDSELFRLISSDDEDERMPKESDPLSQEELALIRLWIEQGAVFDGSDPALPLTDMIPRPPYRTPPEAYRRPVPVTALAFHPTGEQLYVGGFHELTVWNPADGKLLRRIPKMAERTYALSFSPDGSLLAVGGGVPGKSGEVRLLDPQSGAEMKLLGTTPDLVLDLAFRPDGQKLAATATDRTVRIFDVATGNQQRVIESHADWVMGVAWSPDGNKIATASRDKTAKLFEVETGSLVSTYSGHKQTVFDVVFYEDGKQIYSSGGDSKIHLWKGEDGEETAKIEGIDGNVFQLIRAGEHLFSTSTDKTARQHKTGDREQVRSFADHSDWVFSLAVDADHQRLATGCFDG